MTFPLRVALGHGQVVRSAALTDGRTLTRRLNTSSQTFPEPRLDWEYLLDPANRDDIVKNIQRRKGIGDIDKVLDLGEAVKRDPENAQLRKELLSAALQIPNKSHPAASALEGEHGVVREFPWRRLSYLTGSRNLENVSKLPWNKPRQFEEIAGIIDGARFKNLNSFSGEKTYYLVHCLAELEQALIHYTVDHLHRRGFELVSVPDLVHPDIIQRCGMPIHTDRTQVFQLDESLYGKVALSGTAEMAFGGLFMGRTLTPSWFRKKMMAVSRCFRAETSTTMTEKGIYRVHHFTKVEMFSVTAANEEASNIRHQAFLHLQEELFSNLGLAYRVLEMPAHELGAPAYRKFDVEAYLPGHAEHGKEYGEISSCSNCTDYQSRRLDVRDEAGRFCHTVNGTACAIPRMVTAICEQFQLPNGLVYVPKKLQKYMRDAIMLQPREQGRIKFRFEPSPKYFAKG